MNTITIIGLKKKVIIQGVNTEVYVDEVSRDIDRLFSEYKAYVTGLEQSRNDL